MCYLYKLCMYPLKPKYVTVRSSWSRLYRFIFRKRKEELVKFIWIGDTAALSRLGSSEALDKDNDTSIASSNVAATNQSVQIVSVHVTK